MWIKVWKVFRKTFVADIVNGFEDVVRILFEEEVPDAWRILVREEEVLRWLVVCREASIMHLPKRGSVSYMIGEAITTWRPHLILFSAIHECCLVLCSLWPGTGDMYFDTASNKHAYLCNKTLENLTWIGCCPLGSTLLYARDLRADSQEQVSVAALAILQFHFHLSGPWRWLETLEENHICLYYIENPSKQTQKWNAGWIFCGHAYIM